MAISISKEKIHDLYIMVRKGSFQFEPDDRLRLDINGKAYFIGGVERDELTGQLGYSLYDSEGRFIPSANGVRDLHTLTDKELTSLHATVSDYYERSISRCANYGIIINALKSEETRMISFDDADCLPSILASPLGKPGRYHVEHLWLSEEGLPYCSFSTLKGEASMPLMVIDDRGISNIVTGLISKEDKISLKTPIEKTRSVTL